MARDDEERARTFARHLSMLDPRLSGFAGEARESRNELERLMQLPETTSGVIARAITVSLEGSKLESIAGKVACAEAYLHRKLTAEHVAAQEKIAAAAESLQAAALKVARASWGIAFASLIVTAAALYVAVVK